MNKKIILSLAIAIVGYFLGIVADANHNTASVIYPAACLSEILFFLIAFPLANSAGKNIRKESNTTGIPGLRFMSWIMYGVAITHFILFFMWPLVASGNSRLPDGQITIDAAMFFIASMLMIAEAWNSYKSRY
jgi:nicotinamide riboside transporter PnuC